MGSILEQAPPEAGGMRINGEVPIDSDVLSKSLIKDFMRHIRLLRGDHEEEPEKKLQNSDIFVKIPDEATGVPHQVSIEDLTLARIPDRPGFEATFPEEVEVAPGRRLTKEKTIALSVTTAIVVAGSIFAIRHKK